MGYQIVLHSSSEVEDEASPDIESQIAEPAVDIIPMKGEYGPVRSIGPLELGDDISEHSDEGTAAVFNSARSAYNDGAYKIIPDPLTSFSVPADDSDRFLRSSDNILPTSILRSSRVSESFENPEDSESMLRNWLFIAIETVFIDTIENVNYSGKRVSGHHSEPAKYKRSPMSTANAERKNHVMEGLSSNHAKMTTAEQRYTHGAFRNSIRIVTIICTAGVAYLIPNVGLLVSLTGASSGAALGLVLPAAFDLAQAQNLNIELPRWRVALNLVSIFLGVVGGIAGTIYSLIEIAKFYQGSN
jgi:hypothetical protein